MHARANFCVSTGLFLHSFYIFHIVKYILTKFGMMVEETSREGLDTWKHTCNWIQAILFPHYFLCKRDIGIQTALQQGHHHNDNRSQRACHRKIHTKKKRVNFWEATLGRLLTFVLLAWVCVHANFFPHYFL
jgi:hypothetical protein